MDPYTYKRIHGRAIYHLFLPDAPLPLCGQPLPPLGAWITLPAQREPALSDPGGMVLCSTCVLRREARAQETVN